MVSFFRVCVATVAADYWCLNNVARILFCRFFLNRFLSLGGYSYFASVAVAVVGFIKEGKAMTAADFSSFKISVRILFCRLPAEVLGGMSRVSFVILLGDFSKGLRGISLVSFESILIYFVRRLGDVLRAGGMGCVALELGTR